MWLVYQSNALDALKEFFGRPWMRTQNIQVAAQAIWAGNQRDRLAGLDRYGRHMVAVKSTKGRPSGPPLAPRGTASRVIANFRVMVTGTRPKWIITAGFEGIASKSGYPFLLAHARGGHGTPIRNILGVTPGTIEDAKGALVSNWKADVKVGLEDAKRRGTRIYRGMAAGP